MFIKTCFYECVLGKKCSHNYSIYDIKRNTGLGTPSAGRIIYLLTNTVDMAMTDDLENTKAL